MPSWSRGFHAVSAVCDATGAIVFYVARFPAMFWCFQSNDGMGMKSTFFSV